MATEHESTAEFAPVVTLTEVKVVETTDTLYKHRSLLYRFDKTKNAWIQRGLGYVCLLINL